MIIEDTLSIKAPIQKVWDTMLNVPVMVSCLPGIENVQEVDENTYSAVLKAKVAFISATYDAVVTIVDKREPEYLELKGEGKGRFGTGRISFNQKVTIKSTSDKETEVAYKIELNVVGRLATVGGKAIARKSKEMSDTFGKTFSGKCEE